MQYAPLVRDASVPKQCNPWYQNAHDSQLLPKMLLPMLAVFPMLHPNSMQGIQIPIILILLQKCDPKVLLPMHHPERYAGYPRKLLTKQHTSNTVSTDYNPIPSPDPASQYIPVSANHRLLPIPSCLHRSSPSSCFFPFHYTFFSSQGFESLSETLRFAKVGWDPRRPKQFCGNAFQFSDIDEVDADWTGRLWT
jgi:hypothetical protein